jgi:hypothetical protein
VAKASLKAIKIEKSTHHCEITSATMAVKSPPNNQGSPKGTAYPQNPQQGRKRVFLKSSKHPQRMTCVHTPHFLRSGANDRTASIPQS